RRTDDEGVLALEAAVGVAAAGGAGAGRSTRDRDHAGVATAAERRRARNLDRRAPLAVRLADHEGLAQRAMTVAARRAAPRRATRDRDHRAVAALGAERRRAVAASRHREEEHPCR